MTNSEQAIREFIFIQIRILTALGDIKGAVVEPEDDLMNNHIERLTALISEGYVSKKAYNVIKEHYQSALAAKDIDRDYINKYYYPKEFVEWATNHAECDGDGKWYVYSIAAIIDSPKVCKYETALLTTDELYEYWKENER